MTFESRVDVLTHDGLRLFAVPADKAKAMIEVDQAEPIRKSRRKAVREIRLRQKVDGGSCKTRTGRTYTYVQSFESGASVLQHKRICPEDQHFFRAAVLENLVAVPA